MQTAFVFAGGGSLGAIQVGMLRALLGRDYLVDSAALGQLLREHFRYPRREDAALPCHIVTTDLLGGVEVRISSGPAIPALLASAAIPGAFPPVWIDGHYLVDGRAASATEQWLREGVDLVDGLPHRLPAHSHWTVGDPYAAQPV